MLMEAKSGMSRIDSKSTKELVRFLIILNFERSDLDALGCTTSSIPFRTSVFYDEIVQELLACEQLWKRFTVLMNTKLGFSRKSEHYDFYQELSLIQLLECWNRALEALDLLVMTRVLWSIFCSEKIYPEKIFSRLNKDCETAAFRLLRQALTA